jgi:hypothetical protein
VSTGGWKSVSKELKSKKRRAKSWLRLSMKPRRNPHQIAQRRSAELTIVPADRLTPPGDSELEAVAGGFFFLVNADRLKRKLPSLLVSGSNSCLKNSKSFSPSKKEN